MGMAKKKKKTKVSIAIMWACSIMTQQVTKAQALGCCSDLSVSFICAVKHLNISYNTPVYCCLVSLPLPECAFLSRNYHGYHLQSSHALWTS